MLIAQLSDPHLRAQGQLYQGLVDSNAMFETALAHLERLDPQPDLVLISGDIVDDPEAGDYEMAAKLIGRIKQSVLLIPGNHDEREAFRACFAGHDYISPSGPLHFTVETEAGRILGLDVTVPGEHCGELTDENCAWLETILKEAPEQPTLIMMHQPPAESGMMFIDEYNCRRGERLAGIISSYPKVERVLCGHIHRFMQMRFGGSLLMTAPSTCTAIALRLAEAAEPASFVEPPAMLLHNWQKGKELVTHYVPIGDFPGPLPFF